MEPIEMDIGKYYEGEVIIQMGIKYEGFCGFS